MNEAEACLVAQIESRLTEIEKKINQQGDWLKDLSKNGGCWTYIHGLQGTKGPVLAGQDFHNQIESIVHSIRRLRTILFGKDNGPYLSIDASHKDYKDWDE